MKVTFIRCLPNGKRKVEGLVGVAITPFCSIEILGSVQAGRDEVGPYLDLTYTLLRPLGILMSPDGWDYIQREVWRGIGGRL